ncbi:MAG: hypothetical protein LBK74_11000 [Treponema sp.]|jgi:hypothetical protein|nr:hypothetical protein [Treponema sp.]
MKNMVKNCAGVAVVLCTALLFSGCSSIARQLSAGKIIYDESLPVEQNALVVFSDTIHVLEYNGIGVEDSWYPKGKYRINKITLPAGETTIQFNLRAYVSQGNYSVSIKADNIELRFNFEAEKEYTVAVYTKSLGLFKNTEYGVAVWGYASQTASPGGADAGKILKSWKLGEF